MWSISITIQNTSQLRWSDFGWIHEVMFNNNILEHMKFELHLSEKSNCKWGGSCSSLEFQLIIKYGFHAYAIVFFLNIETRNSVFFPVQAIGVPPSPVRISGPQRVMFRIWRQTLESARHPPMTMWRMDIFAGSPTSSLVE